MDTNEIKIRPATEADAAEILSIYAPYITDTAITFEYDVPTLEEFTGRIRHTLEKYPYLVLYQALETALKAQNIINLYACIGYPEEDDEYLTKNSKQFHEHLGYRFEFSPVVCGNDNSVLRCDQTETTDDKFPSDDNDHNPCRKLVNLDHADHGRAYQKLVCQRIHKFSKIGYQVIFSGKMTVKPVCHTCCDKNRKTDPTVCFSSPACQ